MLNTTRLLVFAVSAVLLAVVGCSQPPQAYQVARSDDGRCVFTITHEEDPSEGLFATHRLLFLRVHLDGKEVLSRSWFGGKRWDGNEWQFIVSKADRFYYLAAVGAPEFALAAVDVRTAAVWCGSTDRETEHIDAAFGRERNMPVLTDIDWLVSRRRVH